MTNRRNADLPPRLLRTQEAARFLGISIRTLEKHRTYGTGPLYRKIGGRVLYTLRDLEVWSAIGTRKSTSDTSAGTVFAARPLTPEERDTFDLLIGVSGIGPRGALTLLSSLGPEDLARAVEAEDKQALQQAPGLGPRTAERVIVELKGKLDSRLIAMSSPGWVDRRDEVLIATKFRAEVPKGKTFAQHLFDQCETSLTSLQTDYIDLYQLHWPVFALTPEEVLEPMARLVKGRGAHLGSGQPLRQKIGQYRVHSLGVDGFDCVVVAFVAKLIPNRNADRSF